MRAIVVMTKAVTVMMAIASVVSFLPHIASSGSATYCAPTSDFFPDADTVLLGDIDGDGTTDTVSTTRGSRPPDRVAHA